MAYKKPVPIHRPMFESQFHDMIEKGLKQFGFPYRNCLNCDHWNYDMDGCNKFKTKPPTEIIVYSCEHWIEDIPF